MKTIKTGKYAGLVRGFIHTPEAWYYSSFSIRGRRDRPNDRQAILRAAY